MHHRIVEIAEDARHLSVYRGFLVVRETAGERRELGRVALDDITAVIAQAHGLSYSNNLLVALAERAIPFVVCGSNHNAVAMLLTVDGNYNQAKRFDAQIAATKPVHKRIWAALVRAKIEQQARVLTAAGMPAEPVAVLAAQVRSGDADNREAYAARRYWSLLFGEHFRRNRDSSGINLLLNYGYTVLRAATARAVVAAGLHPTLGVHHRNEGNSMRLVDDLMEPFRPVIDHAVWILCQEGEPLLTPEAKKALVRALYSDLQTDIGTTPANVCIQRLAVSLAQIYLGEKKGLDLPLSCQAVGSAPRPQQE